MDEKVEPAPNIRLLKIVVIALGVLMVAAGVGVVVGLTRNFNVMSARTAETSTVAVDTATPQAAFGDRAVTLPRGARLLDVVPAGTRLALRVELATGSERLIMLDPATGAVAGTVDIRLPE